MAEKCGGKSASVKVKNTANKNDVSRIVMESFQYFKRDIVKSDEECAERLNDYFKQCVETGQIPTVEDMCLALGTVRKVVWDWEVNETHGKVRSNMIKKAKQILAGIDAKLVSEGKIPQVTYIFRAKNFFGMRDQQEVVVTPNNPLGAEGKTAAELETRYGEIAQEVAQKDHLRLESTEEHHSAEGLFLQKEAERA